MNKRIESLLNTMEITESKHTKTNEVIYLGSLAEKVNKDEFKMVLDAVKSFNGYYSKFTKSFVFNSKPEFNNNMEVATMTKKELKTKLNLMELTTYTEIERNTNNNKEIAKEIRTILKNRFKFIKFSVTNPRYSSIQVEIKEAPFAEDSVYMEYVMEYTKKVVSSFKECTCYDPYGDYGSSYNFYGYPEVSYRFIQAEATEEIKEMLLAFDVALEEKKAAEKIEEERRFQEYLAEQKEREEASKIRQQQEKEDKEYINNNVKVVEVAEGQQYFVLEAQFANLNKNNTLAQYQEEVAKGDFYNNNIKITRELHFDNEKSFELFSNMLLHDFDFIEGTGGSYTDDLRINSMLDYYNMSKEEQNTVEWLLSGVAVYFNNELKFVVDAQGYCYARYIGLVGENTITTKEYEYSQVVEPEIIEELKIEAENINNIVATIPECETEYTTRKAIADYFKINNIVLNKSIVQQVQDENKKIKLYNVLNKVDTIQDQFNEVNFVQGEELTIINLSMIGGASISHVKYYNHEFKQLAQYKNNVKLTMNVKGKKGLYETNIHEETLIYKGWLNIPQNVLYDDTGKGIITKYGSYDKMALSDIMAYLSSSNHKPTINTYKPIFD